MRWLIKDSEIQEVEHLLLPVGCHFADDALEVIRHWDSVDVSACPGSGKTTVLLAKLKLLADRLPLDNGAGICVLSHTNVAINEIKKKLPGYADRLVGYPNYIGTIQTFIGRFVTTPYLRRTFGRSIQPLDDRTYAQHMLYKMKCKAYFSLDSIVRSSYQYSGIKKYADCVSYVMALYSNDDGALCIKNQKKVLAGVSKPSAQQFIKLKEDLLIDEGIMRYEDTFRYADRAIDELSDQYTDLFSARFRYVYVDEYQDCNKAQRNALHKLFDPSKCIVTHIGDPDQAIYNSYKDMTVDWCPNEGFLSIASSCRYNQKIADILSPLRKDKVAIQSSLEEDGNKPVLIIYDNDTICNVLGKYVSLLEERGLHDPNGTYKAIGFVGKVGSAGISISSYWDGFDGAKQQRNGYKYWGAINEICSQLQQGKLYRAEPLLRKLICRLFHYAGVTDAETEKEYTPSSIRAILKEKYCDIYADHILKLVRLSDYDRESVDGVVRATIDTLFKAEAKISESIFNTVPNYFMEDSDNDHKVEADINVFIEPLRGRRIQFDTVHGVKGETHDATLYLETELSRGSDISRVLSYYGIGKLGSSSLYNYSRKIVYVGMSRPRKLLCVAIQESTYLKSKGAFCGWDTIDLRNPKHEDDQV